VKVSQFEVTVREKLSKQRSTCCSLACCCGRHTAALLKKTDTFWARLLLKGEGHGLSVECLSQVDQKCPRNSKNLAQSATYASES
jgi:hypothetical protein